MALTFQVESKGAACVIACRGSVVFGDEANALREQVKQALQGTHFVLLDFAEVNYVDSGGLGAIVGLFTSARSAGGDLKVANMNPRVKHVFQITKLHKVIDSYTSVDAALRSWPHAA
jgi:anti-sigma B factor antagonist